MGQLKRERGRLPRSGLVVSGSLHGVVILGLFVAPVFQQEPRQFETFAIELVATDPLPVPTPPVTDDLVIETPEPAPPQQPEDIPPPESTSPLPEAPPEPADDPEPEPEEETDPPEETTDDTPPTPTPAEAQPVEDVPEDTGSNVDVRLEGLRRDYPAYYAGIVQAISDCWRRPPGNNRWETVIYFEIEADGTVSGVRPVQRSGSQAFDLAAIGAIADCAGRGRFGPLPEELPYEILPVQFTFRPSGIG
ncbi:MAG: TonB C-terminal domain-containing protein, partial [Gemmatimonadetes bacterium]|nr:TonB C-terminal domain-containing protein [Gemmatimonadota bacterium]